MVDSKLDQLQDLSVVKLSSLCGDIYHSKMIPDLEHHFDSQPGFGIDSHLQESDHNASYDTDPVMRPFPWDY
ncbi:unnamed protein product [Aspergillus oryzae]|nr:unnamed protein product [Aspergillus oryzae]GMF96298.1 unnamed protein product [Aspergillus oryzae]